MQNNNNSPLGKGLSALLSPTTNSDASKQDSVYRIIQIDQIEKNPYQPRHKANEELNELSESIKEHGIMSPLIVAKLKANSYRLIAGERRLNAAKLAGLHEVPVIVKDAVDKELLELAIIENIQRKDLNPLEEANAYSNLKNDFSMTTAQISTRLGISVDVVEKRIDLLRLPSFIQDALLKEQISMTQAEQFYPLLSDENAMKTALKICIKNQLSTKQLRSLIDKLAAGLTVGREKKIKDDKTREIEIGLTRLIGRKIYFNRTSKGGKIIISFNNDGELDDIYKRFSYIGYHV